jgi:hypothetical protein
MSGKTLKVLLVSDVDAADATDQYVSDIVANEVSNGSYARKTLSNVVISTAGTHAVRVDADDVTWTALTGVTIGAAYVYENTGSDATAKLIARLDSTNFTATGSDVVLVFNATDGICYID